MVSQLQYCSVLQIIGSCWWSRICSCGFLHNWTSFSSWLSWNCLSNPHSLEYATHPFQALGLLNLFQLVVLYGLYVCVFLHPNNCILRNYSCSIEDKLQHLCKYPDVGTHAEWGLAAFHSLCSLRDVNFLYWWSLNIGNNGEPPNWLWHTTLWHTNNLTQRQTSLNFVNEIYGKKCLSMKLFPPTKTRRWQDGDKVIKR